jgi:hypothetical protein
MGGIFIPVVFSPRASDSYNRRFTQVKMRGPAARWTGQKSWIRVGRLKHRENVVGVNAD